MIYKFFQYLRQSNPVAPQGAFGPRGFALLMMGIGLVALTLAIVDHKRSLQSLRERYGIVGARSLATVVASFVALLGAFGLVTVWLRL
jgi:hypothetical protein